MQLPDSTDIIDNLPKNPDQKPNQPKDENNDDDNDFNSTTEIIIIDGNDDNNDRSNGCTDGDSVLDVSGKAWSFLYWGTRRSPWMGFIYSRTYSI
ncbi:hypothetical protein PVK06_004251 [Gossypium arboreum]|uniref:Uncharacterized protein n=1 Tax=Gossypium arboreum TaxID=29729 RepID=A0ABR0QRR5_GOSAR|nr:hypothetical protein PVK06_004251 [Gossypium arboreum]